MATTDLQNATVRIVSDAGGELVGRTRLQKIAYLLNLAGLDHGFAFEYRHYGPYSEDLAKAMEIATVLGPVIEEERSADWGGRYSIYRVPNETSPEADRRRVSFIQCAKSIDAVVLELAATAAYLFTSERFNNAERNPWLETRRRKPAKSDGGRLEKAAEAYEMLRSMETANPLPVLPSPRPS